MDGMWLTSALFLLSLFLSDHVHDGEEEIWFGVV